MSGEGSRPKPERDRYHAAVRALETAERLAAPGRAARGERRTSVALCRCEQSALARLLIAKGIISEDEYSQALIDEIEREIASYG